MRMLAFLLAAVPAQAAIQSAPVNQQVIRELEKFTTDLNSAMARRDRTALDRLLAEEFHFVHAFGYADDKATFIAEALEGPIPPSPPFRVTENMRLHSDGDLVVVINPEGRTASGSRAWATAVYARRDDRWQLLLRQGTEMNPPPNAIPLSFEEARSYVGTWRSGDTILRIEQRPQGLFAVSTRFPARLMTPVGPDLFTTKVGGTIRFERQNGIPIRIISDGRGGVRTYARTDNASR